MCGIVGLFTRYEFSCNHFESLHTRYGPLLADEVRHLDFSTHVSNPSISPCYKVRVSRFGKPIQEVEHET